MKKTLVLLLALALCMTLAACSGDEPTNTTSSPENHGETTTSAPPTQMESPTLEEMIVSFEDAMGESIDRNEKPMYDLIGAKDAVIFYYGTSPVKIYEYATAEDCENAYGEYEEIMKDWPRVGLLVLETNNEEAIDIFTN